MLDSSHVIAKFKPKTSNEPSKLERIDTPNQPKKYYAGHEEINKINMFLIKVSSLPILYNIGGFP